ncbi:MAG: metallophosphoesterase family protein [Actinobacteria bacterium]|nr:metallophosphoesterase family protein [Actinomycetota bacterium]
MTVRALVVSDTHLRSGADLPVALLPLLGLADVVLHAGDITAAGVLDRFAEFAPVHAVLGNNDAPYLGLLPERRSVDLDGVAVGMVHDSGPVAGRAVRLRRWFPAADVVLFGHSHLPVVERVDGAPVLVNPGSPTQRRRAPTHTVAWLSCAEAKVIGTEIVDLGP